MQKFESWLNCLTLKILMQWGKIFLPIPAQHLLQESSEAERRWATEAVGVLVCDHGLSCPFTKDRCLWNSFWAVTFINQYEGPDGDFSGRGPTSSAAHQRWQQPPGQGAGGKCAAASDSHLPVQQVLAPEALRPVQKCHLVTAYHHCSASGKLVLWSSPKATRLL